MTSSGMVTRHHFLCDSLEPYFVYIFVKIFVKEICNSFL